MFSSRVYVVLVLGLLPSIWRPTFAAEPIPTNKNEALVLRSIFFKSATDMSEILPNSVQLAVVTPPYINPRSDKALIEDERLLGRVFEQLQSQLKKNGTVAVVQTDLANGGAYYWRHDMVIRVGREYGFEEVDHKFEIRGLRPNLYRRMIRNILIFRRVGEKPLQKTTVDYNPTGWLLIKSQNIEGFRDAVSPNLAKTLIERFSEPGDFILNPFAGSGTIVAVAIKLGRQAAGYELNPKMLPLIRRRVALLDSFFQNPGDATKYVMITEVRKIQNSGEREKFAADLTIAVLKLLPASKEKNDLLEACSKLLAKHSKYRKIHSRRK